MRNSTRRFKGNSVTVKLVELIVKYFRVIKKIRVALVVYELKTLFNLLSLS